MRLNHMLLPLLLLLGYMPQFGHTGGSKILKGITKLKKRGQEQRRINGESGSEGGSYREAKGGSGLKNSRRHLTAEEQLIIDLFRKYDHDARAVLNTSATVTVQIQFLLLRIQKLDERSQVLLTTGLVITEWKDERLTWDPAKYSNLTDIVVHADRIWLPELAIINGADDMIQEFEKIRVLISSNGKVHWEPGGVFTTTCDIDITYFPFDEQACPIEIGAWAYKSSRMNLTNLTSEMEMQEFKLNGEWDVTHTSATWKEIVLPCCPDIRYSKVVFTLYMNRRYTFYIMNIILPCVLLSILILIVFCVPPDAGEKISSGISVLLAFTVFLLMLADNVPRTSLDVPILVIYLGLTMGLGTASVCLSVLVLNFHHKGSQVRMPHWARVVFLQYLARCFGFHIRHLVPPRVRQLSPHFRGVEDQNGADAMEVQHILKPSNERRQNHIEASNSRRVHHNTPVENFMLKDSLHYHNVDLAHVHARARLQHKRAEAATPGTSSSGTERDAEDILKEWQMLARVLDRLFFIIVFLVTLSSALFLLLSPWYVGPKRPFQ